MSVASRRMPQSSESGVRGNFGIVFHGAAWTRWRHLHYRWVVSGKLSVCISGCVCVVSVCCLAGRQAILFICFQSVCLFASWFANVYTVQTTKGMREWESCPHPSLLLISLRVESSLNLWAQLHTARKRDSQSAKQASPASCRSCQSTNCVNICWLRRWAKKRFNFLSSSTHTQTERHIDRHTEIPKDRQWVEQRRLPVAVIPQTRMYGNSSVVLSGSF